MSRPVIVNEPVIIKKYGTLHEAELLSERLSNGRLRLLEVIPGIQEVEPIPCPSCGQDRRERMATIGTNGDRPLVRRVAKSGRVICKSCAFKEASREAREKGFSLTERDFESRLKEYKGKGVLGLYIYSAAPKSSS